MGKLYGNHNTVIFGKIQESNIDPQYCMSWVEQHKAQIPEWDAVSKISLDWVNQHTSTGSPISIKDDY